MACSCGKIKEDLILNNRKKDEYILNYDELKTLFSSKITRHTIVFNKKQNKKYRKKKIIGYDQDLVDQSEFILDEKNNFYKMDIEDSVCIIHQFYILTYINDIKNDIEINEDI